jgi:hypothetical protein
MWRKIVSPEILLLLGTLQAIFPYVLWVFQGKNESYNYEITYLPLFLYIIGYFFFWLGTRFFKSNLNRIYPEIVKISFSSLEKIHYFIFNNYSNY